MSQTRRTTKRIFRVMMVLGIMLMSSPSLAEVYIAGQVGANFPKDLTEINGQGRIQGVDISGVSFTDLQLENGPAYGIKLGGYFPGVANWLGIELDVYHTDADIKAQSFTSSVPLSSLGISTPGTVFGAGATPKIGFSVTTAAVNALVRYPGTILQPYIGAGIGGNVGILRETGANEKDADVVPAFNAVAGLRVKVLPMVGLFGEFKYNKNISKFKFNDANFQADYSSTLVMGGVSLHF